MTTVESQIKVIAASSKTKHGHPWWSTQGRNDFAGAKYDSHWESTRGHSCVIWDQAWPSLMANSRSRCFCGDQAWSFSTVNSRSWFCALIPHREGAALWQIRQRECLISGYDASPSMSAFSEVVVSFLENTWCLGKWHVYSNTTPLMLVQQVPSSLGYATFCLAQITTIDSKIEKVFHPNRRSCL